MNYVRLYTDDAGESHFEDVAVELVSHDFAPPAPPLDLSRLLAATGIVFVRFPAGWYGDWHPTRRRQFFVFMAGEFMGETSDGNRRFFGPGSMAFVEDTTGKGHRSWVVGKDDVLAAVVQVPA
jgi:hypothetical protein